MSQEDIGARPHATLPASRVDPKRVEAEAEVTIPGVFEPARRRSRTLEPVLSSLGRGGTEHKYLQHLVKRLSEERGFLATIEEAVPGGQVDVALVRDDMRIAVEISVTTDIEHERQNVEKCLSAGFTQVLFVCRDARRRKQIHTAFSESAESRVTVLDPESLVDFLDTLGTVATPAVVRGYKVRITRDAQTPLATQERRRQIAQVVARALTKVERK